MDHVTRGKMLTRLFVVLFIEAADQLFEDRPHGMVIQCWKAFRTIDVEYRLGTKVDRVVEKLLDQAAEDVGFDQCGDLVAEFKFIEDLLNIGREAVKIGLEIGLELLCPSTATQVA